MTTTTKVTTTKAATTRHAAAPSPNGQSPQGRHIGRALGKLAIDKSSGNPYYDQQALRAISEATPFPPLPPEWSKPTLSIQLGFNFTQDRG